MPQISTETMNALRLRIGQLENERQRWLPRWSSLRDYLLPLHGRGLSGKSQTEVNKGEEETSKLYDKTGTRSMTVQAAGMQSGLTSPARPWFRLGFADSELMEFGPVKEWLYQVETAMRTIFARSNVYNCLHHSYLECGGFGTAAMLVSENAATVIRCRPYTIGQFMLAQNADLIVDTFCNDFYMTTRQLVQQFGVDNCSPTVKSQWDQHQAEALHGVFWMVEPNDDRYEIPGARHRPFRSIYFETNSTDRVLSVGGFDSLPAMTPRWGVISDNTYGFGPGDEVLEDIKVLQKMSEKSLIAIDKNVDPPLLGDASMRTEEINSFPGGLTFTNNLAESAIRPLYEVRFDVGAVEAKIARVRQDIKEGLYHDLFLMIAQAPADGRMTATEVAARNEEKLLMLGPVLERLHSELLDPLIDRTFEIMVEMGKVPPAPEEIQGMPLKVEYVSILSQAQRLVGLTGIERLAGFVGNMAAVNPAVLDKFNFDQAVDEYGEALGVAPSLVVSDDVVAQLRQDRAQQQQMAQMAQNGMAAAQGAKVLADTPTGGQTALTALMGGLAPNVSIPGTQGGN